MLDQPTASEIRGKADDFLKQYGEYPTSPWSSMIRDLASCVARLEEEVKGLKKLLAPEPNPPLSEEKIKRLEETARVVQEGYARFRAEGAAAERKRIRNTVIVGKEWTIKAILEVIDSETNLQTPASIERKGGDALKAESTADGSHIHWEHPITPDFTQITDTYSFDKYGMELHDAKIREDERREILAMLDKELVVIKNCILIETARGMLICMRAAIAARGEK